MPGAPDGDFLAVRKHFTGTRSADTTPGRIFQYNKNPQIGNHPAQRTKYWWERG